MTGLKIGELLDTICVVGTNQHLLVQQLRNRGCTVEYWQDLESKSADFMQLISKTEFELIIFCDDTLPPYAIEYAKRWGKTIYIGDKGMFAKLACHHYNPNNSMDMADDIIELFVFHQNIDHIHEANMTHDYKLNFLSYFVGQNDKTLYDVSAGRGVYLRYWRDKGFKVCGSEFTERQVKYLHRHGITAWQIDLDSKDIQLPLQSKDVDIVTCTEVLEHVKKPKDIVREMMRIAKNKVLITTPVGHSYNAPDHIHHWNDNEELTNGILPDTSLCKSVSIHQVVSKPEDWPMAQRAFVVRIEV